MGGGDQPHVELQRAAAADPFQFALLQDAQQLGLKGRRDVADFVEKERAAVGHFEAALARRHGAGEGALLMPEEFRLEQILGQRSAVEADVGSARTWRVVVDGVGDQFLAGARLAADQDRCRPFGDHADLVEDAQHGTRMANEVAETGAVAKRRALRVTFLVERLAVPARLRATAGHSARSGWPAARQSDPLVEQTVVGLVGLHRQHALQRPAEMDRDGNERQLARVEPEPVEEARLVAQSGDRAAPAAFQDASPSRPSPAR
jgi:hypothetical protein